MANTGYVELREIARTYKYVVHETARVKDQRCFAKKQLLPQYESTDADRFRNEVRLLLRLEHPNIIRVIDQQLNEFPLYVITPLYGQNLRGWLGERGRNEAIEEEIEDIFSHVLDAVSYAHEQGVIHRDLKPENILLNSSRDLVVIDFNISVSMQAGNQRLTPTGQPLGTPHYIAPEQLRDARSVDHRTDIFGLGVILYELYGGKIGSSALDLRCLPATIRKIVERCTNADPAKRFSTVRDLIRTWRLARDLNTKQSEINEIEAFMLAENECYERRSERVLELVEEYADDKDLIDRLFMDSDPRAIAALEKRGQARIEALVQIWTKFVSESSWPFSYTDDIAIRCETLWTWLQSPAAKAELVTALIIIANRHNRFFVWRVAARLIEASRTKADIAQLEHRMFVLDRAELSPLWGYIAGSKLPTGLRMIMSTSMAQPS